MARNKKQEEQAAGAPAWMATYGDLVTLLLCFFVLLFAMSTIDEVEFAAAMASFGNPHFANPSNPVIMPPGSGISMGSGIIQMPVPHSNRFDGEGQTRNNDEIQMAMQAMIVDFVTYFTESQNPLAQEVQVNLIEDQLIITFPNNMLFAVGSDVLLPQTIEILDYIANVIEQHPFMLVEIHGHTDSDPINSVRFPNNYWLGFGRAHAVHERFVNYHDISVHRMQMISHGERNPIESNETPEGRQANRRVELIMSPIIF